MTLNKRNILRQTRVRYKIKKKSVKGRPRMSVYRSDKNIYVQIIDDKNSKTLISASSLDKKIKSQTKKINKKETASEVGKLIAVKAKEKGIKKVVFDRGKNLFHGRIKALAESARKEGLEF